MKFSFSKGSFLIRTCSIRLSPSYNTSSLSRKAVYHNDIPKDLKDLLASNKDQPNIINNVQVLRQNNNKCGDISTSDDGDEDELEDMFIEGPAGIEWNGPTRGGKRPEPTRFGDWERKGRVSDF